MRPFEAKHAPSFSYEIWIAGSYADTIRLCREFTLEGLCVAVRPCSFVYTMGLEEGVSVSLTNYPRFPACRKGLEDTAKRLGIFLCEGLYQSSFCIVGPEQALWYSRRPETTP